MYSSFVFMVVMINTSIQLTKFRSSSGVHWFWLVGYVRIEVDSCFIFSLWYQFFSCSSWNKVNWLKQNKLTYHSLIIRLNSAHHHQLSVNINTKSVWKVRRLDVLCDLWVASSCQKTNQQIRKDIQWRLLCSASKKRREMWQDKWWVPHHDNALVLKKNIDLLRQAPYLPDPDPCNLFLFPRDHQRDPFWKRGGHQHGDEGHPAVRQKTTEKCIRLDWGLIGGGG